MTGLRSDRLVMKIFRNGLIAAVASLLFMLPAPASAVTEDDIFPDIVTLDAQQGIVQLTWLPNRERNIAGYRVYYGPRSHKYTARIDVGNNTSVSITNLVGRNFFAVTAYNTLGLESLPSNEVSWP